MSKPKILIIGCGAVGLTQGFHLSAAADITYLVRPGRKPAFAPPKRLYDYQDNVLRTFDNYRVIESASEVSGEDFFCVFDTLDGHTARSEAGTATLRSVGELIHGKPDMFVLYDAIGLDIEEHYSATMGISKDRLVLAGSMLAHQPTKSISVPDSADRELVAQADMLYTCQPGKVGLIVINTNSKITKIVTEMYKKNGRLRVQTMPGSLRWLMSLAMLHLVVWNVDGFQEFQKLQRNKELWSLMLKAQTEILRMPRHGWTGWLLSWVFGSWVTAKMNLSLADGALPLSYYEFNAFHHGGKVVKQDIRVLEELLDEGEKSGRKMPALREVCQRAHKTEAEKAKAKDSGSHDVTK